MEVKRMRDPRKTKIFYFFGKFTFSLVAAMEMYYFSAYLTDAALLPTAIVALVLNIPSVVDFIFSLLNGVILEKAHLPIGKYRFWLIMGPIIAVITYALVFVRYESDMVCAVVLVIMMCLAHFFWSMAETAYNALPTLLTDVAEERSSLSMLFGTAANWSGVLFGFAAMPIINFFNGAANSRTIGYMMLIVITGILYIVAYSVLAKNITYAEKAEEEARANASGAQAVKGPSGKGMIGNIIKNPPLIALLIFETFYFIVIFVQSTLMYYYFAYTLNAVAMMGIVLSLRSVATMVTTFLFGPLMKLFKGNKKSVVILGNVVGLIYMVAMWLMRPSLPVFIVATLISAIISGVGTMPLIAMYADCADYGAYKTGVEAKGFVMSLYNVPVKISLLIKGVVVSIILAAIHYDALATDAASLSAYATGFNNGYFGFSVVMTVLGIVVLLAGYHLSEKKVAECIAATEARKKESSAE